MTMKTVLLASAAVVLLGTGAANAQKIPVGHLADQSGATSDVGVPFGQGVADALAYINKNGGVAGTTMDVETVDYGYQAPRAISQYKKWSSGSGKVAAIQGWGTADTEALTGFVGKDEIPYYSGSYSGHLTDPTGNGPHGSKPAPYNFFYGPSYSDGLRAMLMWAAEDWKTKGGSGKPKYVHMGANHPYPNAPKEAGEQLAKELGFDVLPAVQFALTPGDYTAQCLTLKQAGANYAYLGNTAGSNISVLKACQTVGAQVQFMGNVWGMDENAAKAAGSAANGVIFPVRTAAIWGGDAPGMKIVKEISKVSDAAGTAYRPVHYVSGICSAFYMKEAMDWAKQNGGVTGPNIRKGMYQKKDWVPAGLEGVCVPSTWTETDHRGMDKVNLYRANVTGDTGGSVDELVKAGTIKLEKIATVDVPRKPEWLGW
ncbi:branched-chain amino acid ABC transporter substrate-binding protein (plasmid) [Azospirillum baldaniorum]|uniref:Branched-chain amino acid ABC transporter, periplasmic component n=2 Tax=Azospirillum TaxID=191 RepID=A0A9P1NPZ5_9PROT|nr:ABC transporter substrate-binding protein [Azospirillum baldaniorum]TWA81894.1 amino acid/amide ABC transporter substrate-binding protein (HAAT family) [Azospirillum brasilense]AWJ94057.1 branched-chain amino acid ABC transporter substrate-binding protein [Azospirillum baldaniorum]NUB10881.1 ABC transporter substrate-binding protein [Azospirillum baldaniorum]TWA65531.1 amino acid/amide ABC transporter substrate-binding protein (HAAT family) [Azospirillum baldaniorum]CCD01354.1 putative bran